MKGLELAERYYHEICAPLLARRFGGYTTRIAAGLAGEGSQCYGYDDHLSQDHDWGAAVCFWLTAEDYAEIGTALNAALAALPPSFLGYPTDNRSALGQGRTGALEIGRFYRKFLAVEGVPRTLAEWRRIPEHHLSAATNGKVFADPLGAFSAIRRALIEGYYPEDIRRKKLAARCLTAAQSGQYNLPRLIARGEAVAAHLAAAEFIKAASSIAYLLNRRYQPFYKWLHRGLKDLPILGESLWRLLNDLAAAGRAEADGVARQIDVIETISGRLIAELRAQGLSDSGDDFLLEHGYRIHRGIRDEALSRSNPWVE